MNLNPVLLAIPIFFTLIVVEIIFEAITSKKTYRLNDAITNINLGTLDQVSGVFFKILKIGIYTAVFQYLAFYHLPSNWITFIILFILYDLCYYWSHRMAHEVSLFWGGHVVHHQSEDYNLSVALRQSSTQFLWAIPFYLPLAMLGFDPVQLVFVGGFNLLYQFWIHTEHIDKLPRWFEYILNTPSHHRVHHARNPKYIDTNYAGVFIIWDRMFGTFIDEEERPTYGITTPINSWNPVFVNFSHYFTLGNLLKQTKSIPDALKVLFKKPGWRPEYLGGYMAPGEVPDDYSKYDRDESNLGIKLYSFFQFLIIAGINSFFLFNYKDFTFSTTILYALWIIGSTVVFGLYFELRGIQLWLIETLRLVLIPIGVWFLFPSYGIQLFALSSSLAIISCIVFFVLQRKANY